jgi:hypothetical protein
MPLLLRPVFASLTAGLMACSPCLAFQTPLSDESVREAYFLGQRRDEAMAAFLKKYIKFLPPAKSGPQIYSVSLLTPFALLVQYSSEQADYSAQRAALDHQSQDEAVEISIDILLTASYNGVISKPTNSRSGAPFGAELRSPSFWRSFKYRIFDGKEEISTEDLTGEPRYTCSYEGGCSLSGATVRARFPADAFTSGSATIQVIPPEGDSVSVDFDLGSLR